MPEQEGNGHAVGSRQTLADLRWSETHLTPESGSGLPPGTLALRERSEGSPEGEEQAGQQGLGEKEAGITHQEKTGRPDLTQSSGIRRALRQCQLSLGSGY